MLASVCVLSSFSGPFNSLQWSVGCSKQQMVRCKSNPHQSDLFNCSVLILTLLGNVYNIILVTESLQFQVMYLHVCVGSGNSLDHSTP